MPMAAVFRLIKKINSYLKMESSLFQFPKRLFILGETPITHLPNSEETPIGQAKKSN